MGTPTMLRQLCRRSFSTVTRDSSGRVVAPLNNFKHHSRSHAEKVAIASISGVPVEQLERTAIIYRPGKSTMQSGKDMKKVWHIKFQRKAGWKNPLMGWSSNSDPLAAVDVVFPTVEDAERFCETNGYDYTIEGERVEEKLKKDY